MNKKAKQELFGRGIQAVAVTINEAMKKCIEKVQDDSKERCEPLAEISNQQEWLEKLKGGAQKRYATKRRAVRFTEAQKQVMQKCFDSGVNSKSKRFTPAMCQAEMKRHKDVGPDCVLSENQIRFILVEFKLGDWQNRISKLQVIGHARMKKI